MGSVREREGVRGTPSLGESASGRALKSRAATRASAGPRPAPAAPPYSRPRSGHWLSRRGAAGQSPPLSRLLRGGNSAG